MPLLPEFCMKKAQLFIIDPPAAATLPLDTSVRLACALHQQGAEVYSAGIADLSSSSEVLARCRRMTFTSATHTSVVIDSRIEIKVLAEFAAIHMRKDPPFDLAYLAATWHLDRAGTQVFNRPQALRDYNEKMTVLHFPLQTVRSLVSADVEQMLAFIAQELQGNAIVKPLMMFGGQGVFRVQLDVLSEQAARRKITAAQQQQGTALIVQQFREEVWQGEVRCFSAFGEPVAWCLKVPAKGNFLANTAQGAKLLPYRPSPAEITTATTVAQHLLPDGVYFIGFDMIAGLITEINLTSPRLLLPPKSSDDPYPQIAARIMAL